MQHRWCDVNDEVDDGENTNYAEYIGGVGDADLWVSRKINVLICQYEDDDEYVSYYPASAVIDHAKGVLTYKNTPKLEGVGVSHPDNANKRLLWYGKDTSVVGHLPKNIARYVALFCPHAFSEAEREEALGLTLTEQGELK